MLTHVGAYKSLMVNKNINEQPKLLLPPEYPKAPPSMIIQAPAHKTLMLNYVTNDDTQICTLKSPSAP